MVRELQLGAKAELAPGVRRIVIAVVDPVWDVVVFLITQRVSTVELRGGRGGEGGGGGGEGGGEGGGGGGGGGEGGGEGGGGGGGEGWGNLS